MTYEWNALAGDLRSALAARDWHQAGAIVWQLRQLDGERFTLEFEHYTNEQVRKGGYPMSLETEQRLEAVRKWAFSGLEMVVQRNLSRALWHGLLCQLRDGQNIRHVFENFDRMSNYTFRSDFTLLKINDGRTQETILDCSCLALAGPFSVHGTQIIRDDVRDVLWSIIEGLEPLSDDEKEKLLLEMSTV
tara:strand:- start:2383 stop:2952 length:570 start_codon:yes stop_codon:yes gene_type:complete